MGCYIFYQLRRDTLTKEFGAAPCLFVLTQAYKKECKKIIAFSALILTLLFVALLSFIVSKYLLFVALGIFIAISAAYAAYNGARKPYAITMEIVIMLLIEYGEAATIKTYDRMDLLPQNLSRKRKLQAWAYGISWLMLGLLAAPVMIPLYLSKAISLKIELQRLIPICQKELEKEQLVQAEKEKNQAKIFATYDENYKPMSNQSE